MTTPNMTLFDARPVAVPVPGCEDFPVLIGIATHDGRVVLSMEPDRAIRLALELLARSNTDLSTVLSAAGRG